MRSQDMVKQTCVMVWRFYFAFFVRNIDTTAGSGKTCQEALELGPRPTHPRTSTREQAVVGVGGTANPIKDRLLPSFWKVDTLGVGATFPKPLPPANGSGVLRLEVTVTMCGVLALSGGEGGKTKSVCEGV